MELLDHMLTLFNSLRNCYQKLLPRASLVVHWLKLCITSAEGTGLIPSQGPKSHMPYLRVHIASTKIQCSQTNKLKKKKQKTVTQSVYTILFFSNWSLKKNVCVLVAQSCPTLCDPMDWGAHLAPHGRIPHGILQARILEWVALLFSRGSSQPTDWTWVSCISGRFFAIWATREALK